MKNFHDEPTKLLSYHEDTHELTLTEAVITQTAPIKRDYPINKTIFSIGKNPSNDIVVTDEFISSYHCKLEFRGNSFFLKDLQSTNGTTLNGQRVLEAIVKDKSVIEIGKAKFNFLIKQENKKDLPKIHENYFHGMVSGDKRMKEIFGLIESLEHIPSPVFIHGETGSGKELVARAIHDTSDRKSKQFITVNCGAIAKELIESELFGHEKGSFTGAVAQREGLFEQAHEGTIFLDEIGELPLELQPKLLRVLESGEIRRVGGTTNRNIDVRVITATHRNLADEMKAGRFREDLFYRIYVLAINVPSLRDRKNDIPLLVDHFLKQEKKLFGYDSKKEVTSAAVEKLMVHSWPGNIRELKNVMNRAMALSRASHEIGVEHIQFPASSMSASMASSSSMTVENPVSLEEIEKNAIYKALEKNRWNKKLTATKLGIAKSTLHEKIKKYGITDASTDEE